MTTLFEQFNAEPQPSTDPQHLLSNVDKLYPKADLRFGFTENDLRYHEPERGGMTPRLGYSQRLWEVDDRLAGKDREEKFSRTRDSLYEATIEAYGQGPFETWHDSGHGGPKPMMKFVSDFLEFLKLGSVPWLEVSDMTAMALRYLDYSDMYFLFYDTAVQAVPDVMNVTYIDKVTGANLDPTRIEVFRVVNGWDFKPYRSFMEVMKHSVVQAWGRGEKIRHPNGERDLNIDDILEKVCGVVSGRYDWLQEHVGEQLSDYVENVVFDANIDDTKAAEIRDTQEQAFQLTSAAWIATFAWLKSPMGLEYLIRMHPVYGALLDWDYDRNHATLDPTANGEAVIYGWQILTAKTVQKIENQPAGTCRNCGNSQHCTKMVNSTAVKHKVCSCGELVDPMPTGAHRDADSEWSWRPNAHTKEVCSQYWKQNPPVPAFICHRCLELNLRFDGGANAPTDYRCSRAICPNTGCGFHMGINYRLHALNERRKTMLPHLP